MESKRDLIAEGEASYQRWLAELRVDPQYQAIYEEEAAKQELWLQLVAARMAAGLTQQEMAGRLGISQSQVSRMEKRGYDCYTVKSLRRYVDALGEGFELEVAVQPPDKRTRQTPSKAAVSP